jgi:hypothetical protein
VGQVQCDNARSESDCGTAIRNVLPVIRCESKSTEADGLLEGVAEEIS